MCLLVPRYCQLPFCFFHSLGWNTVGTSGNLPVGVDGELVWVVPAGSVGGGGGVSGGKGAATVKRKLVAKKTAATGETD